MHLKTGEDYVIPDDLYVALVGAYGESMVEQEVEAMRMWLYTNKAKRKTKAGMPKFINSWLARTKTTGGVSPYANQHTKPSNQSASNPDEVLRGRSLQKGLTDISFLDGEMREIQKQYYLAKNGYYYDGTGELKYA